MKAVAIIFWIGVFIVFYTYIGYGMILYFCVKIKELFHKPESQKIPEELPEITLMIAAYNEEAVIKEKMDNCHQLNYPSEKLKIIWVIDGSDDNTEFLLRAYKEVSVCFNRERMGKSAAINRGMRYVKTPYVAFTDANTMLNRNSIIEIVKLFGDKKVGCVAGEKKVLKNSSHNSASSTESIYWKYESKLKEWDNRLYSVIGAAGELFAIRTHLFLTLPNDTLLDDFVLSLKIAMQGYKIAYCKEAYAIEYASTNIKEEGKRKTRIAAGGLQAIIRLSGLFNIFRYGTLSWQYISHRVLRWSITPIFLFALLPLNIILATGDKKSIFYIVILLLQLLFYFCAGIGFHLAEKESKNKFLYIPYYFFFMNMNVFKGAFYLYKNKGKGTWEKAKRI
ncbi:MAG: glycosyltransferase family 2 protein [Bacteroidales bacterium]